jgi:hypothetical protein
MHHSPDFLFINWPPFTQIPILHQFHIRRFLFRRFPEPQTFPDRTSPVLVLSDGGGSLTHSAILLHLLQDDSYWSDFEPPFGHTFPDLCSVFGEEVGFVDSCFPSPFLCDDSAPIDSRLSVVAQIAKAADGKLQQNESDSVVARLRSDPTLAEETQIPPAKLPTQIESNAEIAKEVIVGTIGQPGVQDGLLHADVSAASVDVVMHLLVNKQAPERFLANYVRTSVTALSNIPNGQVRSVRASAFCKMKSFVVQSGEKLTRDIMLDLIEFCDDRKTTGVKEARPRN